MDTIISRFTVFFENPFWVGVFECESDAGYEVCKIIFGAEPKDYEVYAFVTARWNRVKMRVQPQTEAMRKHTGSMNPKRAQREIKKQLAQTGAGTKAQQALARAREQMKTESKSITREQAEAEKQRKFEQKQKKKKEKHKGH